MSQSSPQPDGCQDLAALGRASLECRSERPLAPHPGLTHSTSPDAPGISTVSIYCLAESVCRAG
jgi:hypothetical protein